MIRCRVFSSGYRYVRFASTCTQSLITLSSACQATRTVKLLLPSIELQAASQNSHRYILRALYPCRSLNPKPLQQCSCIPKPMFYFPGDLVGPDPSSAVLPSVLYFPGLMRARRLRLHRHRWTRWSRWSLPSNYYFLAGGAPSRPWQKRLFVPGDLDPITLVPTR